MIRPVTYRYLLADGNCHEQHEQEEDDAVATAHAGRLCAEGVPIARLEVSRRYSEMHPTTVSVIWRV